MNVPSIGKCIYCGRSDVELSREHIVPYGLNGEWILRDATCPDCAVITGQVEQDVLRNALLGPRAAFSMRTRRPRQRKKLFPLQVVRAGKQQEIEIPLKDYPVYIGLPVFAPPAHLSGKPLDAGIVIRSATINHITGPSFLEVKAKYQFDDYVGVRLDYQPVLFARMLAKIGYGMTVLEFGLDAIAENYVLDSILGRSKDVGRWVGSEEVPPRNPTDGLHAIGVYGSNGEIHVRIRLFAQFHQPEYLVVVGTMKEIA